VFHGSKLFQFAGQKIEKMTFAEMYTIDTWHSLEAKIFLLTNSIVCKFEKQFKFFKDENSIANRSYF
jgi:hypothetical protein